MKQFSLKLITATVAVIIAVLSYGLMSFGTEGKSQPQKLHWYFHVSNGVYTYLGESEAPPEDESCAEPSTGEEICMKGLITNPPASSVDNSTPAAEEILREPLNN